MSKIEWCDRTWCPNQGCTEISEGCKNCYAKKMHKRLKAMGVEKYQNDFSKVQLSLQSLTEPTKWKTPTKVFVNSMSDTFHEDLTFKQIEQVFNTMEYCDRHTYLVLTKRPDRALGFMQWKSSQLSEKLGFKSEWTLGNNIWLGVTSENQDQANKRIPILLEIPAKVRFVSVEPMLSEINLTPYLEWLDWVVCGSESGHSARPMDINWARNLRDQCDMFCTPFFFKQILIDGKKITSPEIDGVIYKQFPK